jgi:hypothetical protein
MKQNRFLFGFLLPAIENRTVYPQEFLPLHITEPSSLMQKVLSCTVHRTGQSSHRNNPARYVEHNRVLAGKSCHVLYIEQEIDLTVTTPPGA